ncbi:hypothetical protein C2W64_04588 [Brevibacillus laterosporus]|nr:hypothetical protein [Brevibacillus laterosporus]RAP17572.1 hypothetical protein C2W64_04588 [Brevibacillus laterosporus]
MAESDKAVVKSAFATMEFSHKKEHELVSRIRKSEIVIPELSLVAINKEDNYEIVGHILLSKIKISNDHLLLRLFLRAYGGYLNKYTLVYVFRI